MSKTISTNCNGRASHTEQAARDCAYIKSAQGGKFTHVPCKECGKYHVEERKVIMAQNETIFQCCYCRLPRLTPEEQSLATHGYHEICALVDQPAFYRATLLDIGNHNAVTGNLS